MLVGMWTGAAFVENSIEIFQKIKNRTTILSNNSTIRYFPKEYKNTNSKRYMHLYVYCSIIYNSQDIEVTRISTDGWMDKEDMVHTQTHTHTHREGYYTAIKEMRSSHVWQHR